MHLQVANSMSHTTFSAQRCGIAMRVQNFKAASLIKRGIPLQNLLPKRKQPSAIRYRGQNIPVQASFFGVGAPEAVLVGVVALVLFGPKGLAQAAKSIGQTIKAFAPTIRELTQVSTEIKSTLENEIGLNDLRDELQRPFIPEPLPSRSSDSTAEQGKSLADLTSKLTQATDDIAKIVDPEIERKRAEAAQAAWGSAAPASAVEKENGPTPSPRLDSETKTGDVES